MNENPVHAKGVTRALGPLQPGWSPAVKTAGFSPEA